MRLIAALLLVTSAWAAGAERIISTAPSITELLYAMGLGPKVVGVTIYCKYPPEAVKLPKIGGLLNPDVEAIVGLKPDLVVIQKHANHLDEEMARFHIASVVVDSQNLKDVFLSARAIGKAAGAEAAAEQLIASMQSQLDHLRALTAGKPQPTVAFIVGSSGGRLEGLVAGSGTSYFSDLLRYAGAKNIFDDVSVPYPRISLEEIVARDPDVILQSGGETEAKHEAVRALWRQHHELKAVRNGRVYALESNAIEIAGPRAVDAVKLLIPLLHPDVHP